ncbi:MAG: hypothetical protein E7K85_09615 [Clostridium sp.]|uniref:hypothetical protein n=1 Tax=Clostridium TaxID=1485 RepID=UPI0003F8A899|nr:MULTISPECIES: hypothetical protein [Clostridium]MBS6889769.1 hypothetical protein [Clostridium sp.]MDB2108789.1 hypothetical protein [Clostridium paraputrificum]MDB2121124.1 hypothetical protein [Clostridium paraputrificum]MDU2754548.1 hypothetical protein [Clostridium sp.]MDU2900461.1 hypothetical protein [Clostridium sp.]
MNRAEARIKNYQNSNTQIHSFKNKSLANQGISSFLNNVKSLNDELNFARKLGRKKKRR